VIPTSENGWTPSRVGPDRLTWITVPGTKVQLQIMSGQPLAVLRAAAADFNAYIEPLRDTDSASWTPTNSVATSNHLNGTACDWNWDSHPFRRRGSFTAAQLRTIREMLDFYEGFLFWAGDWDDPIDEMHWQMGYGSYGNPKLDSFISRKIRSDGFSTFRRGPTQVQPKTDPRDDTALLIIGAAAARQYSREDIIAVLSTGIQESGLNQAATDSTGHRGVFQQDGGYPNRETVGGNVTGFLDRLDAKRHSDGASPDIWKNIFWLQQRPSESSADIAYANGRANYLVEITSRQVDATGLYDRLSTPQEDDMSAEAERKIDELYRALLGPVPSRSALRMPGEGNIGTVIDMIRNIDGMVHPELVADRASLGDPREIDRLRAVAGNPDPARAYDAELARKIAARAAAEQAHLASPGSPAAGIIPPPLSGDVAGLGDIVVELRGAVAALRTQVPTYTQPLQVVKENPTYNTIPAAVEAAPITPGELLGNVLNALIALQLSSTLPATIQAPLDALVQVVQTNFPKEETP